MRHRLQEIIRQLKRTIEYGLARIPGLQQVYWRYASAYYRWKLRRRFDHDAPLDPLRVLWIDPSRVSRFTGRQDATTYRYQALGLVESGDWDQRPTKRIEETVIYRSFVQRFRHGVSWDETELFSQLLSGELTKVDMNTESADTILSELKRYDGMYRELTESGYRTQHDLRREMGVPFNNRVGLLDLLTDEITLDIGRNGELLFVDGRHRLCLAKIVGLKSIPIVVLVRHTYWIQTREECFAESTIHTRSDHPDIAAYL